MGGGASRGRRIWGSGGDAPSRWAIFRNFLEKNYFNTHWITFWMYLEPFERTRFLTFESQVKKIKLSGPPLLAI